ncbi:tRNA A64-2'-O-ribosylphosphate transferase [Coemansia sp. RSA 2598]|nr:tRNA A64-2'-O-ribosylphosphate transferase [Coemansia sp. RSA 2598]
MLSSDFDEIDSDDFYGISNQLRKEARSMYNRLRSIEDDSQFVRQVSELLPNYPVLANERCGLWYVDPLISHAQSVYFKSTDGHNRNWKFSLRRANTHLFDVLRMHGGCVIVDSTRQGKRMPDSFSKTIPIWCAVWNYFRGMRGADVCVPGELVSPSEKLQIDRMVPGFAKELAGSGVDFAKLVDGLDGVLKPMWVTRDRGIEELAQIDTRGIVPVICVSASACVAPGSSSSRVEAAFGRDAYMYVQGAADDHELWAQGLTPRLFWKHRARLLQDKSVCEQVAREVVDRGRGGEADGGSFDFVGATNVAVGGRSSGRPPECWNAFDAVINCGAPEYRGNGDQALAAKYLFLEIPEGKKGQVALGRSIRAALEFARPFVQDPGKRLLVHCSQGMDRSVGIALAILTMYFDLEGKYSEQALDPSDDK